MGNTESKTTADTHADQISNPPDEYIELLSDQWEVGKRGLAEDDFHRIRVRTRKRQTETGEREPFEYREIVFENKGLDGRVCTVMRLEDRRYTDGKLLTIIHVPALLYRANQSGTITALTDVEFYADGVLRHAALEDNRVPTFANGQEGRTLIEGMYTYNELLSNYKRIDTHATANALLTQAREKNFRIPKLQLPPIR